MRNEGRVKRSPSSRVKRSPSSNILYWPFDERQKEYHSDWDEVVPAPGFLRKIVVPVW